MLREAKQNSVNGAARPELRISENALAVLRRRYLRRGPDGKPIESVAEMFYRVASHVAGVEDEGEAQAVAEAFYELLTTFRFMPNSPTFTGAGTPLGTAGTRRAPGGDSRSRIAADTQRGTDPAQHPLRGDHHQLRPSPREWPHLL